MLRLSDFARALSHWVRKWQERPKGPNTDANRTECNVKIRSRSPSNMIQRAVNKLIQRRCSQRDAAVGTRENNCTIPASFGTNCTFMPPDIPSAREPGIIRLRVSGCQEAIKSTKYAIAIGTNISSCRKTLTSPRTNGAAATTIRTARLYSVTVTKSSSYKLFPPHETIELLATLLYL